jgi:hypothetical protein
MVAESGLENMPGSEGPDLSATAFNVSSFAWT